MKRPPSATEHADRPPGADGGPQRAQIHLVAASRSSGYSGHRHTQRALRPVSAAPGGCQTRLASERSPATTSPLHVSSGATGLAGGAAVQRGRGGASEAEASLVASGAHGVTHVLGHLVVEAQLLPLGVKVGQLTVPADIAATRGATGQLRRTRATGGTLGKTRKGIASHRKELWSELGLPFHLEGTMCSRPSLPTDT